MDFRLRVFLSVARNLSFTKASRELNVSQPAITKHIQELEGRYGMQFFSRQGGKIELTRQGELFAIHAERIVQAYSILQLEMDMAGTSLDGGLRIGASLGVAPTLFGEFLPWLSSRYPHMVPEFFAARQNDVEKSLFAAELDFAFLEEMPQRDGVECIPMQMYGLGYLVCLQEKEQTQLKALVTSVELWNNICKGKN